MYVILQLIAYSRLAYHSYLAICSSYIVASTIYHKFAITLSETVCAGLLAKDPYFGGSDESLRQDSGGIFRLAAASSSGAGV